MPLDPFLAERMPLIANLTYEDAASDPEVWSKFAAAFLDDRPYERPEVGVRDADVLGDYPCRVRVYTPTAGHRTDRPALVWAHGGGFTEGTLDDHEADTVAREVCVTGDVVVVSVDYPLANGSTVRYPILHRSLMAAFTWTLSNAVELGVDAEQIALGGASAGGNLTVAATMELRDTGRVAPARLVLVYPGMSSAHVTNEEHELLMADIPPLFRLEQDVVAGIWATYAADAPDTTYLSFEHMPSLGELPPILLVLSEYDDLRVSAEEIFDRPEQADLEVERYLARGVTHGHLSMAPVVPETRATLDRVAEFVKP
ncbi:putative acetyl esterase [metagenome]|uniref:Putative acetyl esterase n=1 Tax=metagenome TaxID=256318 RepID=A0A2P2C3U0_9ZZZZ